MNLVFATNNANKMAEVVHLLPKNLKILSLKDINCIEDIPEKEPTIEGNAIQKAQYIWRNYGENCFADDTGLLVDCLNGAPGVHSARYAGEHRDANANMKKLLENLKSHKDLSAHFKTVIALIINGTTVTFTGICQGKILREELGHRGFGYDPIFVPQGFTRTFAEMSLDEKNKISHRGQAMEQLKKYLTADFSYKS